MERLTTDKEVYEMEMFELAHNSCCAEDGKARYRDYVTDIDARQLTIKLLEKYADIPNEFTCDEDFDDFILDATQYGTDNILGLVATFYRNLWAMADLRERLKYYEDLEEQRKLLKLPCSVGDRIYIILKNHQIKESKVVKFKMIAEGWAVETGDWFYLFEEFGKIVFLTKEAAEAALQKMN